MVETIRMPTAITPAMAMVRELTRAGADVKLTICYGVGHNAWEVAYQDPDLIDWMLAQKRKG